MDPNHGKTKQKCAMNMMHTVYIKDAFPSAPIIRCLEVVWNIGLEHLGMVHLYWRWEDLCAFSRKLSSSFISSIKASFILNVSSLRCIAHKCCIFGICVQSLLDFGGDEISNLILILWLNKQSRWSQNRRGSWLQPRSWRRH